MSLLKKPTICTKEKLHDHMNNINTKYLINVTQVRSQSRCHGQEKASKTETDALLYKTCYLLDNTKVFLSL